MIEAIDLTVRRRGRTVLDAVSFDVRPGQVTGVLGSAGAGKTTLLRRMVQLDRGGGETLFDGCPYQALLHPMREIGLVLDEATGYPDHTVRGHLRLALSTDRRAALESGTRRRLLRFGHGDDYPFGQAGEGVLSVRDAAGKRVTPRSGVSDADASPSSGRREARRGRERPSHRIDAVLDIVGLSAQRRTRLEDLTDGMATRLAIATALLGDPKALLLDCPDRGLEPAGVAWLGDVLRAFTSQGRAALVTCSDTETLASLADRILLLDAGCLVGTRTAAEVHRAPSGAAVIVRSPQIVRFAALLAEAGARSSQGEGASLEVRGLDRARIGDLAYRHGVPLHELAERFTGSDPGDVVLAACSGRGRAVVPIQTAVRAGVRVGAGAKRGGTARAGASRAGAAQASGGQAGAGQAGAVRTGGVWTGTREVEAGGELPPIAGVAEATRMGDVPVGVGGAGSPAEGDVTADVEGAAEAKLSVGVGGAGFPADGDVTVDVGGAAETKLSVGVGGPGSLADDDVAVSAGGVGDAAGTNVAVGVGHAGVTPEGDVGVDARVAGMLAGAPAENDVSVGVGDAGAAAESSASVLADRAEADA